ncbi:hypothetical protein M8818_006314 [Zalaria obscura]|uniref:Uncharacterized protein n=1 Tax=Zalaria obscura TaxID=2024903 RepID=A0ACC3S8H5_9PEZI
MAPALTTVDISDTTNNTSASTKNNNGVGAPKVDTYCTITPIPESDRLAGTTSLQTIQEAVEAFHRDGFSAISNAISPSTIDALNEKMLQETTEYLNRPTLHFNQGKKARNISQTPPLNKEWFLKEIYGNPHALSILEYILGPRPELRFINSNLALPNPDPSARQAVHSDAYHAHAQGGLTTTVVVNIYLTDVSPANGATEVWPGTHAISSKADHVSPWSGRIQRERFCAQALIRPPGQVTIPKGSICFRDIRTWHSGMPNLSPDPRIMLALAYFPRWYRSPMRLILPESLRAVVTEWEHCDFEEGTDWVEGELDHLNVKFAANWTQDPEFGVFSQGNGMIRNKVSSMIEPDVVRDDYWMPGDSDSLME